MKRAGDSLENGKFSSTGKMKLTCLQTHSNMIYHHQLYVHIQNYKRVSERSLELTVFCDTDRAISNANAQ